MNKMPKAAWLAIILMLVLVGGFWYVHIHINSQTTFNDPKSTGLVITRDNSLNQPGVSNFSKTVSHSMAKAILADINALKLVPEINDGHCPMDDGVTYTFDFTNPTLHYTASATGCQWVGGHDKSYQSTEKFWNDVSRATHEAKDPDKNFL